MQRTTILLTLAIALLAPATAWSQGLGACELCGQAHAGGAPAYVTDWETNQLHRFGSFDCALESMRQRYAWSRAALGDLSTGERITVTRVQGRWTVRPEDAVVVVRASEVEGGCAEYDFFASRDEHTRHVKRHKRAAKAGPPPERLADFVDAFVGRRGGSPAAAPPGVSGAPATAERPDPPWADDAVGVAKSEGIMEGYPDGSFNGDGQVTRYEMAVIAKRLLERMGQSAASGGAPLGVGGPGGVPPSTGELVGALEEDLTAAGANRGEVSAALEVLRDAASEGIVIPPATPMDTDWPDVPADHWASASVAAVTGAGVMNGYPDGTFNGKEPLTRYEIAVIAARLLSLAATAQPVNVELPVAETDPPAEVTVTPSPATPLTPMPPQAEGTLSGDARAHLLGLKAQLMLSGMSEAEADRTLEPTRNALLSQQGADANPQAPLPQPPGTSLAPPTPPEDLPEGTASSQATLPGPPSTTPTTEDEATYPLVRQPNMLGVSGFLLTPSADEIADSDSITAGIARSLDSNLVFGTTRAFGGLELGLLATSGALPSRLAINAKKQVWISGDRRSRAAVGVIDATDEIDTTLYGVFSKSFRSHFWDDEPHDWTLSVGLGAGDLLDGVFGSAYVPLDERLAVGAEIVDFGDRGAQLNYGLEYDLGRGWHVKTGMVDGEFAAEATIERDL